jgi:entericidin B
MKRIVLVVVTLMSVCQLAACNTVRGMGEDIKKGGEAIEKAAK